MPATFAWRGGAGAYISAMTLTHCLVTIELGLVIAATAVLAGHALMVQP